MRKRLFLSAALAVSCVAALATPAAHALYFGGEVVDDSIIEGRGEDVVVQRLVGRVFMFLGILVVLAAFVCVPAGIVLVAVGFVEIAKAKAAPDAVAAVPAGPDNVVRLHTWSGWCGFSGRIGRETYLIAVLGGLLLNAAIVVMAFTLNAAFPGDGPGQPTVFALSFFVSVVLSLFLFWVRVSATVRRLHDLGQPGWWYLLGFVPFLGGLASVVMFFILAIVKGAPEKNEFGVAPALNA